MFLELPRESRIVPKIKRTQTGKGPAVTEAMLNEEICATKKAERRNRNPAASQKRLAVAGIGNKRANRPACIPRLTSGTTQMFPTMEMGERE